MTPRTTDFLIAAIGDVSDVAMLNRIHRKVNKQLRQVTAAPAPKATPARKRALKAKVLSKNDLKPGDKIIIGTERGEHTKAQVVKVNRKRVQAKLLEKRGRKKTHPKGEVVEVYPDMLRARA